MGPWDHGTMGSDPVETLIGATYAPSGPATSITLGNGVILNRTLGQRYLQQTMTAGIGGMTEVLNRPYVWNGNGEVAEIQDLHDLSWNWYYTYTKGMLTNAMKDGEGNVGWGLDVILGNRQTETHFTDAQAAYAYQPGTNRLLSVTQGQVQTNFGYNAMGDITTYGSRTLAYNAHGRLVSVAEGGQTIAAYAYDGLSRRISKTTASGTTRFVWDSSARLLEEQDAADYWTKEYVWLGGEPLAMVVPAAEGETVTWFVNDHLGTPQVLTDAGGDVVWRVRYEPYGAVILDEDPDGDEAPTVCNLRFPGQYDDAETGWSYNYFRYYAPELGRYLQADPVGVRGDTNPYAYARSSPLRFLDPLGLKAGDICTKGPRGLTPLKRWYDAVGNRMAVATDDGPHAYTYDPLNLDRLTAATHPLPVPNEAFTYDTMGNRLTSSQWTNWSYDAQNDELDSYDGISFTYDANGNRQTKTDTSGTTTYAYDYENRLVRVDKPGGSFAEYAYDALARRVRKNVDGQITLYWYDGEDIVLETDGAGAEQARYTHGPGIDNPLKLRRGGANYCYHEDPLGSVVLLTDSTQAIANSYGYDTFGRMIVQTGMVPNPYTYTAREWDAEAGLYYYRARHYDAAAGRFLQTDPIGPTVREGNLYAYVGNRPTAFVDPSGRMPVVIPIAGGVVIFGSTAIAVVNRGQVAYIRGQQAVHFRRIAEDPAIGEEARRVAYDLYRQYTPQSAASMALAAGKFPSMSTGSPLPGSEADLAASGILVIIMEALGLLEPCPNGAESVTP